MPKRLPANFAPAHFTRGRTSFEKHIALREAATLSSARERSGTKRRIMDMFAEGVHDSTAGMALRIGAAMGHSPQRAERLFLALNEVDSRLPASWQEHATKAVGRFSTALKKQVPLEYFVSGRQPPTPTALITAAEQRGRAIEQIYSDEIVRRHMQAFDQTSRNSEKDHIRNVLARHIQTRYGQVFVGAGWALNATAVRRAQDVADFLLVHQRVIHAAIGDVRPLMGIV